MSNGRIAVLCPSRGNPEGLAKLIESVKNTSERAAVITYVERPQAGLYREVLSSGPAVWHLGEPGGPAAKANRLVELEPDYDIYGMLPDDSRVLTPGWDRWMIDTVDGFPNRLGVVSAHHNGGDFVNFAFVSRQWIDLLGWLACPDTQNYVWDTVLEILGEATKIVYATPEQFLVYHERPVSDRNVGPFVQDCVQFFGWCIGKRRATISKIRKAMAA